MADVELNCDLVDATDIERAYLRGTLTEADAEAFEAHYFACDRCWASLQRAIEQRAAFSGMAEAPATRRWISRGRATQARWPLAVAASIVLVVAASSRLTSDLRRSPAADDTERGRATAMTVRASTDANALVLTWLPVHGAERYRVRLFAPDGTVLIERTVTDTIVGIPRDSLSAGARARAAFWSVDALDATRQSLARSSLVAVTPLGPTR